MHASADNPPTDDARPIPPRFWWLKRIGVAIGVLIVGLVVLRLWWGWEADRRLQAKIAEYRAAGQPVLIEDFQQPPVPDEENAAYFLMKAAEAIKVPDGVRDEDFYIGGELELVEQFADAALKITNANAETFRLAHAAASKTEADWKIQLTSPVWNITLYHLSEQRRLARLLCLSALQQHRTKNDSGALAALCDVHAQGDAVGKRTFSTITQLMSIAIHALAADAIEEIAPSLNVGPAQGPPSGGAKPAHRADVIRLIELLLNESRFRENWRWSLYGERMSVLDFHVLATTRVGRATLGIPGGGFDAERIFAPMYRLDAILALEMCNGATDAAHSSTFPVALNKLPLYPALASGFERQVHALSSVWISSSERSTELSFRILAMRRMAAVALAIRLYELDNGTRPDALDRLLSKYVSAIPVDPFAKDGRHIGYCPDAARPVLYSVGSDGVDDGGRYVLDKDGCVDNESADLVFFLNGDRPWVMPESLLPDPNSQEAVEDNRKQPRDHGQSE